MNKYEEALKIIISGKTHPHAVLEKTLSTCVEVLNKEIEFESRKEKLVVWSEWECVAECYGEHWTYKPTYKAIIKKVGTDYANYIEISSGTMEDNMPTEQFLLCFKPKENV